MAVVDKLQVTDIIKNVTIKAPGPEVATTPFEFRIAVDHLRRVVAGQRLPERCFSRAALATAFAEK